MRANLSKLTIGELLALYDAYAAASAAYASILSQPRSRGTIHDLIEELYDDTTREMQRIARHVSRRVPANPSEREAEGELLVQWHLACGGWRDLVAAVRENFEPLCEGSAS